ncbi:hypothetical protein DRO31_05255 [Candidatus Bathyarchaeota archaeon]|nr:MAG: hypothetical protein DRO31_05255 [Candidatus Bathyarchaeota archaeon]
MILYSITKDVDLPSGAIIIWMESNSCPAGYSKVADGYYVAWGSSYLNRSGSSHTHTLTSHQHSWGGVTTESNYGSALVHSVGSDTYVYAENHSHSAPDITSDEAEGTIDSQNSPGLQHVTVVLCKKD